LGVKGACPLAAGKIFEPGYKNSGFCPEKLEPGASRREVEQQHPEQPEQQQRVPARAFPAQQADRCRTADPDRILSLFCQGEKKQKRRGW